MSYILPVLLRRVVRGLVRFFAANTMALTAAMVKAVMVTVVVGLTLSGEPTGPRNLLVITLTALVATSIYWVVNLWALWRRSQRTKAPTPGKG